jgi:phosphoribosylformylglycinamidine synthase
MRAAVVLFPGSNADIEMVQTLRDVVGMSTSVVWHGDSELPAGTDLVALPGGFSYGDYLRCGAIASASPIIGAVKAHAERGGHIIGVCNGFQILTEVGLLPGALTRNAHLRFECRDIAVKAAEQGPFCPGIGKVLRLPIAHAEGRYVPAPNSTDDLDSMVAFRYCTAEGEVTEQANPNGSVDNIAGIYGGPKRNVLGLMPHPERMSENVHGHQDGKLLFEAVCETIGQNAGAAAGTVSE